jgi:hypothetical protein
MNVGKTSMLLGIPGSILLFFAACSDEANPIVGEVSDSVLSVSEIRSRTVIGLLGVPLGEPVEIRAIIIDGSSLKNKVHASSYLLMVTEVNGSTLSSDPIFEFSLDHAIDVQLAADNFDLFLLKYGTEADEIHPDQLNELKEGYVGKSVSLVAYESGEFRGMPSQLPDEVALWQDRSFSYEPKLEILIDK